MSKNTNAFTIVELIVVIAIIGILTAIVTTGFSRYQENARDAQRSSKTAVIAESLEKYYDQNGEYPGCAAMIGDATTITKSVLIGIDTAVLVAPKAASGVTNSIKCLDLTSSSGPEDYFAYVGDASAACSTGQTCLQFSLKYREESTGNIVVINSRRRTDIATSGSATISVTPTGFTTMNVTWTTVNNATGYTLQRATNNSFTADLIETANPDTTIALTGLAYNTTYYFRVKANTDTNAGIWSAITSGSTWGLAAPNTTATAISSTNFTSSWAAIPHAAGYNTQCSTDGATWSGCTGTTTGLSYGWGPTWQGKILYFRTQAMNDIYTGSWSNIANATTSIDAPAAYNIVGSQSSWSVLRGTATSATCPAGTTPFYRWTHNVNGSNTFWAEGSQYPIVDHGLNWNDSVSITVTTRCTTSATQSGWTAAGNNASMSLPGPTVSAYLAAIRVAGWSGTCPAYTTYYNYYWRLNGYNGPYTPVGYRADGPTTNTSWDGTAYVWGDGAIHATINCAGPWGVVSAAASTVFGSGCINGNWVDACNW